MKVAQHTTYNKKQYHTKHHRNRKTKHHRQRSLIKVSAAGVNPLDNMIPEEKSRWSSLTNFLKLQERVVGIVESIGKKLTTSDRRPCLWPSATWSYRRLAEYLAVDTQALAKVPDYLSDEEAGGVGGMAIPIAKAKDWGHYQRFWR